MPHELPAQATQKKPNTNHPNINYVEPQQSPYLLYNTKDIYTEYPNWDIFFKNLMDSFKAHTPSEIKQNINTKPPVIPLSFAKNGVQKYFPERCACFQEIISTIQQDRILSHQINIILNQTIMKRTIVHKETDPRPSNERDRVCAILMFLEGMMDKNNFALYIDGEDKLGTLSCEPSNRQVSDTLRYKTRLDIADDWIMSGEMTQRVSEADKIFQD